MNKQANAIIKDYKLNVFWPARGCRVVLPVPYGDSLVLRGEIRGRGEEATHAGLTPFLLSWGKDSFK